MHVHQRWVVSFWHVVRGDARVFVQFLIRDWDPQVVAQLLRVVVGEFLHLVGGVTSRERGAKGVTLNRVCQDHGRLPRVFGGRLVGRVDLAVVVATAFQGPDLVVSPVLNHRFRARVTPKEVFPHVRAVVRLERLVVTIQRFVHDIDEGVVLVCRQQLVPAPTPNHFDDVPAGTLEEGFQLLDDLPVTAHGSIQTLQVRVHHKRQVVQPLN